MGLEHLTSLQQISLVILQSGSNCCISSSGCIIHHQHDQPLSTTSNHHINHPPQNDRIVNPHQCCLNIHFWKEIDATEGVPLAMVKTHWCATERGTDEDHTQYLLANNPKPFHKTSNKQRTTVVANNQESRTYNIVRPPPHISRVNSQQSSHCPSIAASKMASMCLSQRRQLDGGERPGPSWANPKVLEQLRSSEGGRSWHFYTIWCFCWPFIWSSFGMALWCLMLLIAFAWRWSSLSQYQAWKRPSVAASNHENQ